MWRNTNIHIIRASILLTLRQTDTAENPTSASGKLRRRRRRRMKLGQSVANGGAAAAAILSLSLSPCPPPPPARGELLPLRVRSCVSAADGGDDGPVAG